MKKTKTTLCAASIALAMSAACASQAKTRLTVSGLNPRRFASTVMGKKTNLITLTNKNGMEACITNYGARVVSLCVPDKNGKPTDVVLGFDNIHQYADTLNTPSYFGACVGRYANRIKGAKLLVGGKAYSLRANDNGNSLHGGGKTGWANKVYDVKAKTDSSAVFTITSPDGDNGFPGTVNAQVTYTVRRDNTLDIAFSATTDKETVVNMINHSFFNLNGDPSRNGENQIMYVNADRFTPVDASNIPIGDIVPVDGTPMDFRKAHALSEHINDSSYGQIRNAKGYDHNWVLNTFKDGRGDDTSVAASLYSPETGIMLEVFTNEPGLQIFTANSLNARVAGKHGTKYPRHAGVCFESQKFPDSPTKLTSHTQGWECSNPYLKPGQEYHGHVAYTFSIRQK